MIACGRRNYPYAGVENGDLCLCSNTTTMSFVPRTLCNVQCSGTGNYPASEQPSCGALSRISVYDVRNRITGLQIHHIPPLSIYKKITVTAGVTTGQDAWFSFKSSGGANTVPPRTQKPVSTYIFDRPGKSEVSEVLSLIFVHRSHCFTCGQNNRWSATRKLKRSMRKLAKYIENQ